MPIGITPIQRQQKAPEVTESQGDLGKIGKVVSTVAPALAFIPGVGAVAAGVAGAAGGLAQMADPVKQSVVEDKTATPGPVEGGQSGAMKQRLDQMNSSLDALGKGAVAANDPSVPPEIREAVQAPLQQAYMDTRQKFLAGRQA